MLEPHQQWEDGIIPEDELIDEEELERLYEPCPPRAPLPQWPLYVAGVITLLAMAMPLLIIIF